MHKHTQTWAEQTPSRHTCTHKQLLSVAQCMYCRAWLHSIYMIHEVFYSTWTKIKLWPSFFFLVCPLFSPLQIQNVHTFSIHESFKCQLCWLISAEFLFAKVSRIKIYRLQFLSFFFSTNLEIKLKQKWDTGLLFQPRQF